jgi:hypothetical protein
MSLQERADVRYEVVDLSKKNGSSDPILRDFLPATLLDGSTIGASR